MLRWSDRRPLPEPAPRLMSVNLDASGIGQLAVKLGLTTEGHVLDCLIELDDRKAPGLRCGTCAHRVIPVWEIFFARRMATGSAR